jgi:hypothetical protein
VRAIVHVPLAATTAGVVPGTRAPPASRMLTVEPGAPVPVKATVREGTVELAAGEVTAKGEVGAGSPTASEADPLADPFVTWLATRCWLTGAVGAKIAALDQMPFEPTAA